MNYSNSEIVLSKINKYCIDGNLWQIVFKGELAEQFQLKVGSFHFYMVTVSESYIETIGWESEVRRENRIRYDRWEGRVFDDDKTHDFLILQADDPVTLAKLMECWFESRNENV